METLVSFAVFRGIHFKRRYVSLLTSSPFTSPHSPWIPALLVPLLSKHCPLSSPLRHKNTRRWWLFCFWILVNIFILTPVGGPWATTHDEELLKIFVLVWYLFTLQEEVGEGRGGWVPFLKFTWTRVQTAWRGRSTLRVWVNPPHPPPTNTTSRQTWFIDIAGIVLRTKSFLHTATRFSFGIFWANTSGVVFLSRQFVVYYNCREISSIVHNHFWSPVCGVLCRIRLYKKTLHFT